MYPSDVNRLISFLLDAIETAIKPTMINRSWIEKHIRPVVEDFFNGIKEDAGTCYIGDEVR